MKKNFIEKVKLKIASKKNKPSFGSSGEFNYAVKIDSLESNDFYERPFGRQLEDLKKVKNFKEESEKKFIGSKGIPTIKAVKEWIKENNPEQFYAQWRKDTKHYKSDVVEIWVSDKSSAFLRYVKED